MDFPKRVEKVWGEEIWFANDPLKNYCGKELIFKPGFQTSIHRHPVKDEVFYITEGSFIVYIGDDPENLQKKFLRTGERLHVPAGQWHRLAALNNDRVGHRLIEVSTYHSDDDVERTEPSGFRVVPQASPASNKPGPEPHGGR